MAKDYEKTKKLKKLLENKPKFSKFQLKKLPPIERNCKNKSISDSIQLKSISESKNLNSSSQNPDISTVNQFNPTPLNPQTTD
jgi:hypothetical protein